MPKRFLNHSWIFARGAVENNDAAAFVNSDVIVFRKIGIDLGCAQIVRNRCSPNQRRERCSTAHSGNARSSGSRSHRRILGMNEVEWGRVLGRAFLPGDDGETRWIEMRASHENLFKLRRIGRTRDPGYHTFSQNNRLLWRYANNQSMGFFA